MSQPPSPKRRGVTVIGGVQADVVISPVTELPPAGATRLIDQMSIRVGGAGANAALAFVETGLPVRLMGCVGEDRLGEWMREELTERSGPTSASTPSGSPR
jgi:sugar/nucleoside kinase (ribokinase family)